ncbi:F-box/kelch-repeat protein At1g57790-like [Bidens hawaiensis]|uniref:F-box/kelch-repeat protein At1g57790-like n=1 Tax=Bidens hawaiensis TaxID=980011 RepID=UPI0040496937
MANQGSMGTERPRSWTDLPMEMLSFIAIKLPLLELLSFRGTCKDFRSASSTATAAIESSKKPWLLFHKSGDSKFVIYNENKTYNREIPDIAGAVCLASYQGWLLLHKDNTMFFFSPFSLSKIPLPKFPKPQIQGHVGAFSNAPTSKTCIVSIINPIDSPWFKINMISKGGNTWTQHKVPGYYGSNLNVTGATYDNKGETFYYMFGEKSVLGFSVKDKIGTKYNIVEGSTTRKDTEYLPYFYYENMFPKKKIKLEDDEYVDVCGLTYENKNSKSIVYLKEAVNVSETKTRMCKAVWIQPRFYEASKDLQW